MSGRLGMHPLKQYLHDVDEPLQDFARRVGASRQTLYRIISGRQSPKPALASAIFAYNDYKELFRKVEKVLKRENKEEQCVSNVSNNKKKELVMTAAI